MFTADDRLDMIGPSLECHALLRFIACAIINSADTALVAADVIENCFDDVRRRSGFGHVGCHRSAQIVMRPMLDLGASVPDAFVEGFFANTPAAERPTLPATEYEVIVTTAAAVENGLHGRHDRNDMARPFLVRIAGSLISSLTISDQRKAAISLARWPVSINSRTIAE